jgi:hypothetical protein
MTGEIRAPAKLPAEGPAIGRPLKDPPKGEGRPRKDPPKGEGRPRNDPPRCPQKDPHKGTRDISRIGPAEVLYNSTGDLKPSRKRASCIPMAGGRAPVNVNVKAPRREKNSVGFALCRLLLPPTHTYLLIYLLTNLHTYIHTYINTYMHIYMHIHTNIYIHAYMHTYIHTNIHTRMHIYIHTYIHT